MRARIRSAAAAGLTALLLAGCVGTTPAPAPTPAAAPAPAPTPPAQLASVPAATVQAGTTSASATAPTGPADLRCAIPGLPVFNGTVVAVGDSLAQGLSALLDTNWTPAAYVDLTRNSSGLARPDFYDTVGNFRNAVAASTQPGDIAVIWLGANDAQNMTSAGGGLAAATSTPEAWNALYASRVREVGQICVAGGIDCYWLVPAASDAAVSGYTSHRNRMNVIRQIITQVGAEPELTGNLHVVDTWAVRDNSPGWDPAHPGMSGLRQAVSLTTSSIAQTRNLCMGAVQVAAVTP